MICSKAVGHLLNVIGERALTELCIAHQVCCNCGGALRQSGPENLGGWRVECTECETEYYFEKE